MGIFSRLFGKYEALKYIKILESPAEKGEAFWSDVKKKKEDAKKLGELSDLADSSLLEYAKKNEIGLILFSF